MVNWGIIGYGRMGKTFANCFNSPEKNFCLKGIASKSNFNLIQKIKTFKNYDELIYSQDIDAIYISTLNNTHKDLVIKSIEQKKKVLCEKPVGLNLKEVRAIHSLIKEKKNDFFEAIAYRSHPQTERLIEILKNQNFGKINKIEANFGFKNKRIKKDSRLFNKDLGGGSILDLGCYPISFFYLFVNTSEDIAILKSNYNLCETGVDINAEIHLKLNNEIDAIGKVSLSENLNNVCKIYFENATILVSSPWLPSEKAFLEIETKSRYFKDFINTKKNVYEHQILEISKSFEEKNRNNSNLVTIEKSLEITKILDEWQQK